MPRRSWIFPRHGLPALAFTVLIPGCSPEWGGAHPNDGGTDQNDGAPPANTADAVVASPPGNAADAGGARDSGEAGDAELAHTEPPDAGSNGPSLPGNARDGGATGGPIDPCKSCDPRATCAAATSRPCLCPAALNDVHGDGSECVDPCATAGCDAHAACRVSAGAASCECTLPYLGDGKSCRLDSTCSSLKCAALEKCVVSGNSIACDCKDGYMRVGTTCVDIPECQEPSACTQPNQVCNETPGSFTCTCRTPPNLIDDPGFEQQTSASVVAPWVSSGSGTGSGQVAKNAHGGVREVRLAIDSGWWETWQRVPVDPHTRYRVSAWVKTSDNCANGWFGARSTKDNTLGFGQLNFPASSVYRLISADVTSNAEPTLDVYLGAWATAGSVWLDVDDISLEKLSSDGTCP